MPVRREPFVLAVLHILHRWHPESASAIVTRLTLLSALALGILLL